MHVETRQFLRFSVWLHIFNLNFARRRIETVQTRCPAKNRTINRLPVQIPPESCPPLSPRSIPKDFLAAGKFSGLFFADKQPASGDSASREKLRETATAPAAFPFSTGQLFSADRGENRLETRPLVRFPITRRTVQGYFSFFFSRLSPLFVSRAQDFFAVSRESTNRENRWRHSASRCVHLHRERTECELTAHRKLTCVPFYFIFLCMLYVHKTTMFSSFVRAFISLGVFRLSLG